MVDDVVVAKAASIERSVKRAIEEFTLAGVNFVHDCSRQDAALMNVQRACETAIDLAQQLVRVRALGVPSSTRDLFTLLEAAKIIDSALAKSMRRMVGFRNVAVHEYQRLDMAIVVSVIERELAQILRIVTVALRL
jgi:uncharacterized protein YutE (UPF0331/DUF86 family)